ncbi:hypothetical protein NPIL_312301 [Nephila pilipes]|uniref:Uncharacterized protein n=1 Tax=Nephila pilipes TaxID=299642 RepID=A0A8X6NR43_NEPPI|nr:hypothetical protein NPIL_312301 [Nephila pilipes]
MSGTNSQWKSSREEIRFDLLPAVSPNIRQGQTPPAKVLKRCIHLYRDTFTTTHSTQIHAFQTALYGRFCGAIHHPIGIVPLPPFHNESGGLPPFTSFPPHSEWGGGRRIISAAAEEAVGTRAGGSPEMRANRNSSITPDPASITEASGKLSSPKSGIAWRWWKARSRRQR